ncbi:probable cytochrome P450 6a14 [Solenopsis invicta]|uniref:probable cytochrome P450 6a14 n=1 Tax=Solenopsis invicta TaxID=13686 RepID=UPI00193EB515|nr:probable cytochrome P450 6a14 [Solenopsis invicta]
MYSLYKPNLVIADLDHIRTVLTKEFKSFHDRGIFDNDRIDPLSGNLFFMPGKRWRNMRAKLTPTFTSDKIKHMFFILKDECSEELVKHLESKAQVGEPIKIKDIFGIVNFVNRYTTDVIMSTAFGVKSNCIEESNNQYRIQRKKYFGITPIKVALIFYMPQVMNFLSIPATPPSVTKFYINMFRENVEYRKAHHIVRHDFMNLLIQLMDRDFVDPEDNKTIINESSNITKLTMEEAAAQSFIFFAAGFETSATTMTFALYELAQQHDIQDKTRNEIDEVLTKHGELTYDAVNDMTYLQKVISETLRKYPPVSILNRICTKEIELPNFRVPKGTLITIPLLELHRDLSIYQDPDKFDPERFNADEIKERHPYAYMPFGEGPRNCIGLRFGYLQVKVGLLSLLSKYKFKLHSRTAVPLTFYEGALVLQPKSGVHLIIEPR